MQALELTDIKDFMNKFLRTDIFDNFLLQEGMIAGAASYTIDGRITHDFYSSEETEELGIAGLRFLPYRMLRDSCFDLIKGKKTPVSFRFVLLLSPENISRTLAGTRSSFTEDDITGMFYNIHFQDKTLTLTTGVSYKIFSVDKSLEQEWDRMACQFLKQHKIPYTKL